MKVVINMSEIIIGLGIVGSCISVVLSILYVLVNRKMRKDMNVDLDANGIVSVGSSMDDRDIFVCSVEMRED